MCTSCGKKTTISHKGRSTSSGTATVTKARVQGGHGTPYGSPKVRMSFGSKKRY